MWRRRNRGRERGVGRKVDGKEKGTYLVVGLDVEFDFFAGEGADSGSR